MDDQETQRISVHRFELLKVIQETAGVWEDSGHPELATPDDVDEWLHRIRANWRSAPSEPEEKPCA